MLPIESGPNTGRQVPAHLNTVVPSSLSQFEEAIGHGRGRRGGDGESLVDCFQML